MLERNKPTSDVFPVLNYADIDNIELSIIKHLSIRFKYRGKMSNHDTPRSARDRLQGSTLAVSPSRTSK